MALEHEPDIVLFRERTRRVAELLGFDRQDQTRITTAVSELARNAFEYAGSGRAEFRVKDDPLPGALEIIISDKGPGMADLDAVLRMFTSLTRISQMVCSEFDFLLSYFRLRSSPSTWI